VKIVKWRILFLLVICTLIFSSQGLAENSPTIVSEPGTGYGSKVQLYDRPEGTLPFTSSTRDIGILQGNWYEMGVQYGKRAGDLIAAVWEGWHQLFIPRWGVEHTYADIRLYEEQMNLWAPQFLEFIEGIADGAAPWLDQAKFADDLNNFDKVFYITLETSMIRRHPPKERHPIDHPIHQSSKLEPEMCVTEVAEMFEPECTGCSAFAIAGTEWDTLDGTTIHTQNCDCPSYPHLYSVSFFAIPDEEGANAFWSHSPAGCIMGLLATNEKGLTVSHDTGPAGRSGSGWFEEYGYPDFDFGVPWRARMLYSVVYCNTTEEALEVNTLGHEQYREKTGRSTVLRDGGSITVISDPDSVVIAEVTAHNYGIRYPGDYGEVGNYVVTANTFLCLDSYDGEGNYYPDRGMRYFQSGDTITCQRHWTLFHLLKNNVGNINSELAKEFMSSHFYIDEEGTRVDYMWHENGGWVSAHYLTATVCSHRTGYPENLGGGTLTTRIVTNTPNETIIEWVKGHPCQWIGPWDKLIIKR